MPLGFDDRFRRLWEYYLAYCEAGFLSGNIDVRPGGIRQDPIARPRFSCTRVSRPDWQHAGRPYPMTINKDVVEAIGKHAAHQTHGGPPKQTGCTILGKARVHESRAKSVKDRAGKWMILEAEEARRPQAPAASWSESTAGNTGIGLAVVASGPAAYRTPDCDFRTPRARKRRTCCGCAAPN